MGILKTIKKAVKKTVNKALSGVNDKPKKAKVEAQLGPSGDTGTRATTAMRQRQGRRARGRDSTIITQRSGIGSRTLLG
jgi:hypothetical protein